MRRTIALTTGWLLVSHAAGMAAVFSWDFQRTGFRSYGNEAQTAISMRNDRTWPIVYAIDEGRLNAYSLFPTPYSGQLPVPGPFPQTPTYWHPIGEDLTQSFLSSGTFLQAATGRSDGFGVALQRQFGSPTEDRVVHGSYAGGFQAAAVAQALKFNADDEPFVGTNELIPQLEQTGSRLYDVAFSKIGDVAGISQSSTSGGPITYWQKSALLGDWQSQLLGDPFGNSPFAGWSADLLFDAASKPHVFTATTNSSFNSSVIAYRFDVPSGSWLSSILDTGVSSSNQRIVDVAAAANDDGIVGAAWVNNGVLKYAFMDTTKIVPSWVTTTVAASTPTGEPLEWSQGVGLTYDSKGLPVISFVERFNRQVWVAYDPPVIEGDVNFDGVVDGGDLEKWQLGFGVDSRGDADGDGDTDGADFLTWQRNLTPTAPSTAAASIPEPAAISLASVWLASLTLLRRTRGVLLPFDSN